MATHTDRHACTCTLACTWTHTYSKMCVWVWSKMGYTRGWPVGPNWAGQRVLHHSMHDLIEDYAVLSSTRCILHGYKLWLQTMEWVSYATKDGPGKCKHNLILLSVSFYLSLPRTILPLRLFDYQSSSPSKTIANADIKNAQNIWCGLHFNGAISLSLTWNGWVLSDSFFGKSVHFAQTTIHITF